MRMMETKVCRGACCQVKGAGARRGRDGAFLQALLTLMSGFEHQQSAHRDILIQPGPVDPNTAANQAPVAQSIRACIAKLRKPFERHGHGPAVLKMDDQIAFEDLYAKGPGLLRSRNTHAISP